MSKPNADKSAEAKSSTSHPPSAPFQYDNQMSAMRAPPPTYEESQRHSYPMTQQQQMPGGYLPVAANQYYGMTHHQQLPLRTQQIQPYNAAVLTLDSRAEVRTTASGAVIIPPPPPGCPPTPAQAAAMQGQPVVLKQKKRSFF